MTEYFINYPAQTTLVSAIDASMTTLEIVAVPASPPTPQFRIRIDHELLLATNVSGPTYTVVRGIEGSVAAAHDVGATVRYVLSAGALGFQSDPAANVPGLRSLGTGAQQAAAGNDPRFGAATMPLAHATTHQPGGSDPMAVDAAPAIGSLRTLGTGASQAAAGNDARFLSASSTPTFAGMTLTGPGLFANGSAAAPSIAFASDTNTGFYRAAEDQIGMAGHLVPSTFNTQDLGSTATHMRTGYFGTSLWIGNWGSGGNIKIEAIHPSYYIGVTTGQALNFGVGNATRWSIWDSTTNWSFMPAVDNQSDLGWGTRRVRSGYFATSLVLGGAILVPDGSNTLALQNGANAQKFNLYSTYTDASNWGRLKIEASTSIGVRITTQGLGTGVAPTMYIGTETAPNAPLVFMTGNSGRWQIHGQTGYLFAAADNLYDIGRADFRTRYGFFSLGLLIYGTYTDASNWSRLFIQPDRIITESSGTGVTNALVIGTGAVAGNAPIYFQTNNVVRWSVHTQGALMPSPGVDNTYDLGRTTERVRTGFFGTSIVNSGFNEFVEMADAPAPAANNARLYSRDNGSGKTQLVVRFPAGAVQVIATEP